MPNDEREDEAAIALILCYAVVGVIVLSFGALLYVAHSWLG